jgi:hypothetical protein
MDRNRDSGFDPKKFQDQYEDAVKQQKKQHGEKIEIPKERKPANGRARAHRDGARFFRMICRIVLGAATQLRIYRRYSEPPSAPRVQGQ